MLGVKIVVVFLVACAHLSSADQDEEISNFRIQAINSLQQPFNNLQSDVYGHFHRSQNTLRGARQNLYQTASSFPYYRLNADLRKNLVTYLDTLIYKVIDPTVEFVQKASMDQYYAFNSEEKSVVEQAFLAADSQLSAMSSDCGTKMEVSSRKLMNEYSSFISSINDCTREMSRQYRSPISEFTRVHFVALPLINRLNRELNGCSTPRGSTDQCIKEYLAKNCLDHCSVSAIINAVKDQSEKMVKEARSNYDVCLNKAKDELPTTPSFLKDEVCLQDSTNKTK